MVWGSMSANQIGIVTVLIAPEATTTTISGAYEQYYDATATTSTTDRTTLGGSLTWSQQTQIIVQASVTASDTTVIEGVMIEEFQEGV